MKSYRVLKLAENGSLDSGFGLNGATNPIEGGISSFAVFAKSNANQTQFGIADYSNAAGTSSRLLSYRILENGNVRLDPTIINDRVKKFSDSSQKVRRAQILMKSEANGPAWTDNQIADAFGCRTKPVENIRQRLVESGFTQTLEGKMRSQPSSQCFRLYRHSGPRSFH